MQEYANCFSNTGTQIPTLPPHPEGNGMLGFLNPLLNEKLAQTRFIQQEILRRFQGLTVNFHLSAIALASRPHSPALRSNPSPVGGRSSIHLAAARLKQIRVSVANIGPFVLQFLKGAIKP